MLRTSTVVAGVALFQLGCAEQLQLLDRGPTAGVSPCSFWPPPPSSATCVVDAHDVARGGSLSSVAGMLELRLRGGGYSEQRWFPIGAGHSHGFAITTRLERVEGQAGAPPDQRWSSVYPDAVSLRWLEQARTPPLPGPGRYRVFLVSYTDLPVGRASSAPVWNEETLMDWPNAAERGSFRESGVRRALSADYRLGIYEYDYEWDDGDARGRFVPSDAAAPNPAVNGDCSCAATLSCPLSHGDVGPTPELPQGSAGTSVADAPRR